MSNENINNTISFALAENGSGVTVVITITSHTVLQHIITFVHYFSNS